VCGDSRILVIEEGKVGRSESWRGAGWRYMTVQITDCLAEHAGVLERGGTEGAPPRRMGEVAVISFVRDPDGNFIELSQRASLLGGLATKV
jgi:lactoylglutathione lyase